MDQLSATVMRFHLSGEYDISNMQDLKATLKPAELADSVIIDMTGTTFIDSSALHCLVHLTQHVKARGGGAVHLLGVRPAVRRLFTITGLDELFEIGRSEEL